MKRTVSAHISGIVFQIEEDAYELLKDYLQRIRRHFKNEEGVDEIMEDLESRIAELFRERLHKAKEVVTEADVEAVIGILGRPEDFGDEVDEEEASGEERKRRESAGPEKRIFRNPDDKVLGGVCSGLSAYFGLDPLWLRLLFVLALFFAGTGPLIYIVLWIIIPEARTRAEKLQMRGEPVDLDNLKRKMKEESEDLKERFNKFTDKVDEEEVQTKGKEFTTALGRFFGKLGRGLGRVVRVFGGFLLLILGFALSVSLLMPLPVIRNELNFITTPEVSYSFSEFLNNFISQPLPSFLFQVGYLLFFGVTVFVFLFFGASWLFGRKGGLGRGGPVLFILWLIGFLLCLMVSAYAFGDQMF